MARFDFLEFGGPTPDESSSDEPKLRASHDEQHWLNEADVNRRKGHYENALRFYSRALEEDKALIQAWTGQVQMLVLLDELPEADLWARKALEIFAGNGELLAARAQALCRLGDRKQAIALCDGSMSAQGRSAYRWQVRGELMLATKQKLDAHCFDKAQQLDRDWLVMLENALVYLHYDMASLGLGRARGAVEAAPDQYYAWYVYGLSQAALGLHRPAKESIAQCLKLCPQHVEASTQLNKLNGRRTLSGMIRRMLGRG
jgi:tetratricopeptide (TPR) repeat protein